MKAVDIEESDPIGFGQEASDEQENARFLQWQAEQDAAEKRQRDDHFRRYYTDPEAFREVSKAPEITAARKASPDPDVLPMAALNKAYLSEKVGRDLKGAEYEAERNGYALAHFDRSTVTDPEFFDLVKGQYETMNQRESAVRQLHIATVSQALRDTLEGKETPLAPVFQQWAEANRELIGGEGDSQFLTSAFGSYRQARSDIQKFKGPAAKVWNSLTKFTQGKADDRDVLDLGREMSSLAPQDRQRIYSYAAMAAEGDMIDRSNFLQIAKNLGESISRGFGFLGKGGLSAMEGNARLWINELERGNVQMGQNGRPRFAAPNTPNTRELTGEEREALQGRLSEALPMFQIARELKALAQGAIDPIIPVAKGGGWGLVEGGAYSAAGSIGLMGATAINPMVGVVAYKSEELDRILLENPEMNWEAANNLAMAEAGANALIDKLQIDRLPGIGALVRHSKANGWRGVVGIGKEFGRQAGQELLQNAIAPVFETIASALRDDMPDKDPGKEFEQYLRDIPETLVATGWITLISGGLLSVRNVKNPMEGLEETLAMHGISKKDIETIKRSESPEEFDSALQQAYANRQPEDIAAGLNLAQQRRQEAQGDQDNPERATIAVERGADDATTWTVYDPEGNVEFQTQDKQAAEEAYAEASRRIVEDALFRQQEEANGEQALAEEAAMSAENSLFGISEDGSASLDEGEGNRNGMLARPSADLPRDPSSTQSAKEEGRLAAPAFTGLGASIVSGRKQTRVVPKPNGDIVFEVNENDIYWNEGAAAKRGLKGGAFSRAIFGEELVHTAHLAVLKKEWQVDSKGLNFSEYVAQNDKALFQDIRDTINAAPPDQRRVLQEAVQAVYNLYVAPLSEGASKTVADLDTALSEIESAGMGIRFAEEFIRQTVQLRRQGTITEEVSSNILKQIGAWVRSAIAKIRETLPGVYKGEFGQQAKALVESIERELDGQAGRPPAKVEGFEVDGGLEGLSMNAKPMDPALREQIIEDKLNELRKNPEERLRVYEAVKDRLTSLIVRNREEVANLKEGKASADRIRREKLINAIGELNALLRVFPPEIRGKVGGFATLANIGTGDKALHDFMVKRIEMVGAELERSLRKEYDARLQKLFRRARPAKDQSGKKRVGKAGAELHELFDTLKEAVTWDADKAEAHVAALEAQLAKGEMTPEQEAHARIEIGLVPLFVDWKNADAERRSAAVKNAEEVWDKGYRSLVTKKLEQREQRAARRDQLISDTGTAGTAEERDARALRDNGLLGRWKSVPFGLLNFEQSAKWVFGDASIEAERLSDMEREASHTKEDVIGAKMQDIDDLFTEIAGGRYKGEQLRHRLAQKTMKAGKRQLSELEAITATLMWRQEDGRNHMIGQLDENGKPISNWHYDQAFIDQIESQLSPEAKIVRQFLSTQYAGEHATLNPIYREVNGIDLPKKAEYSPLTVVPMQAQAGQVVDPVTGSTFSAASTTPGSLRNRSGRIAEPDFRDALQTYIAHTKQIEHWKAYVRFTNEAQALLGNRDVGNSVKAAAGTEAEQVLRNWIDFFAQGGTRDAAAHLAINQAFSRMSSRAASVALVGRIGTLAIQSTQLAAASAQMPAGAYMVRLGKLFAGQLGWGDAFSSPYIQRRLNEMPPIVRQAVDGFKAEKPSRLRHAVARMGQLIGGADALFTSGTYAIIHDYQLTQAREMGLSGESAQVHALQATERIVDRIAQPTRPGARSLYENTATHPLARVAWAFASDARKNLGLLTYAAAKRPLADKLRAASYVVLLNSAIAGVIRAVWADARDSEDDEWFDEKHWNPNRLALSMATEWMYGVPVFGEMAQQAIFKAAGEWLPEGNLFSSAGRSVPAIMRIPETLAGEQEADEVMRDVDAILSGMGLFNANIAAAASISHLARDLFGVTENVVGDE